MGMTHEEAIMVFDGLLNAFNESEHGDFFYDYGEAVCQAASVAISALREQEEFESKLRALESSGWISVEERLPEKNTIVLCYKDSQRRLGYYIGAEYGKGVAAFRHPKDQFAFGVTHWMPLPEPPKEEV